MVTRASGPSPRGLARARALRSSCHTARRSGHHQPVGGPRSPQLTGLAEKLAASPGLAHPSRRQSVVRADDLEVAGDEDVMGPVDADAVDLVLAVAQAHHSVDDTAGVRGQRRFGGLGRRDTADDRARPLLVIGRDLADALGLTLVRTLE